MVGRLPGEVGGPGGPGSDSKHGPRGHQGGGTVAPSSLLFSSAVMEASKEPCLPPPSPVSSSRRNVTCG